jgi:hypothetical protein
MAREIAEGLLDLDSQTFQETEYFCNQLTVFLVKAHLELKGLTLDELFHLLLAHSLPA